MKLVNKTVFVAMVVTLVGTACAEKETKWVNLFNGKDLTGWENPYDWGNGEVVDGEIHLTTKKSKWFLCTAREYSDFVFEADVKMPEGKSNSGFMFRAHKKKNKVSGYQAEVDPSDRKWSGGLYDEGRRQWFISPKKGSAKSVEEFRKRAGECFKRHGWNRYRIVCRGDHIQIFVNGVKTTDCKDDKDAKGYLALQHHGEKGKVYKFRNIRIIELKEGDEVPAIELPKEESASVEGGEWVSLFDGKTLDGWQTRKEGKPGNWVIVDGCIHRKGKGGDIVTVKEFKDFEMEFEWKISPKGNSGVKYRFVGKWGPEYQVLDDDGHDNGRNPFTSAGAMYLMASPDKEKVVKPVGEFNKSKIVAKGNHLEHWLNGKKVLEIEIGSDQWNKRKKRTKFKHARNYGETPGKILLQDHGDLVWYKNIRIRELK